SAATLKGGAQRYLLKDKQAFIAEFTEQLAGPSKHSRVEVFYTPYAAAPNLPFPPLPNFLVLWWDVVDGPDPNTPNGAPDLKTACALSKAGEFGAPFLSGILNYAAGYVRASQYFSNPYNPFHIPPVPTAGFAAIALDQIESQVGAAHD